MQIVQNVKLPVNVVVSGVDSAKAGYVKTDLLVNARVLKVYPKKLSQELQRPSAFAVVEDSKTGITTGLVGFNENADIIAALEPGEVISATGSFGFARNGSRFILNDIVDDAPQLLGAMAEADATQSLVRDGSEF